MPKRRKVKSEEKVKDCETTTPRGPIGTQKVEHVITAEDPGIWPETAGKKSEKHACAINATKKGISQRIVNRLAAHLQIKIRIIIIIIIIITVIDGVT